MVTPVTVAPSQLMIMIMDVPLHTPEVRNGTSTAGIARAAATSVTGGDRGARAGHGCGQGADPARSRSSSPPVVTPAT